MQQAWVATAVSSTTAAAVVLEAVCLVMLI